MKLTEEIKQALEEATTPCQWLCDPGDSIDEPAAVYVLEPNKINTITIADNLLGVDAHLIANSPTWLSQLLQRDALMVEALKRISDLTPVTHEDAKDAIQIASSILEQIGELE